MNIKQAIMHYILVYDGCETGIIKRVVEDFNCSYADVYENINWLISSGHIKVLTSDEIDSKLETQRLNCSAMYFKIIKNYEE